MRTVLLTALFVLSSTLPLVHANSQESVIPVNAPRGLDDVMADMGVLAKGLAGQITDPAKNADSANKSDLLKLLCLEALPLMPPKIDAMPDAAAKRAELLEYQKSISSLFILSADLELALLKGDNATAIATFSKIKELQRSAHTRFKSLNPAPENDGTKRR